VKSLKLLFLLAVALLLASCGGQIGPRTGDLSLSITDAPVQYAGAVVIYVEKAIIKSAEDGRVEVDVTDPVTQTPGRSIDLLKLTGDRTIELLTDTFTEGTVNWIRLMVDFDPEKTYIQINGIRYPLRCTSCEKNGLKVNTTFEILPDMTNAYTLDFDLQKSITDPQSGVDYILRPTIRVVRSEQAGSIQGHVDASLISSLSGAEGCSVYVYDGNDAQTDDIYIPGGEPVPADHNNPVTAATVELNSQDELYAYHAAFLPAGNYTIALTCDVELDDPMTEDELTFYGAVNKMVYSGQTTTHNFEP
jgi:hypothetical protein